VYPDGVGVPTLGDIGIGLGRQSRFGGQTRLYHTVLAHVLTVADIMPEQYAIYGLLHDAPEAIMGDTPTPWKHPAVVELEDTLYERIIRHYELPWPIAPHVQAAVNEADRKALIAEAYALQHPHPEVMHGGGDAPEWVDEVAEVVHRYRDQANQLFIDPTDPDRATLAFHEPEIAERVYTEAFEYLVEKFDPAPLAVV
jgi:hypothetical protein